MPDVESRGGRDAASGATLGQLADNVERERFSPNPYAVVKGTGPDDRPRAGPQAAEADDAGPPMGRPLGPPDLSKPGLKAPSVPPLRDSARSLPPKMQKERIPRQPWQPEDRVYGIKAYADLGTVRDASEATGIPERTLERWLGSPEASQAVETIRRQHARTRSIEAGSLWDRAVCELRDRLDHGDHVLTKEGELARRPVGGRDLAVIAGIMADKTQQWSDWASDAAGGGSNVTPDQFLDVLANIETLRSELAKRQAAKRDIEVEPSAPPIRVQRPGRKVRSDAGVPRRSADSVGEGDR